MLAAVYLRQSLDRTGLGAAVDRQRQECLHLVEQRGWTPVEYVDNDKSASSGKRRPAYERLLLDLRDGAVQAVTAWHPDRIARRPDDLERLIAAVEQTKAKVATVQAGEYDLNTPSGRAVARTVVAWARAEVEHKGERQKASNVQAAQQGRPPSGPRAFGYEKDGIGVREAEAADLREAYSMILNGGTLRAIARAWNDAGHLTTHGNPWRGSQVRRVLQSPRYAGKRGRLGETVGDGQWPALVEEDTWRAVQRLLSDADRRTTPDTTRRYLLSGLARCGVCGAHMDTGRTQHGVRTLKCSASRHLTRAAEPIEDLVERLVVRTLAEPDLADLCVTRPNVDVPALRDETTAVRVRLDEAAALYGAGTITGGQLTTTTAVLRERLERLEGALADATRGHPLAPYAAAEDPVERWHQAGLDERRAVVDTLIGVRILSPGRGARTFDPSTVDIIWRTR